MKNLLNEIEELKNSEIKKVIDSRLEDFEKIGNSGSNEVFKEMCFCLMTANFSAKGGIKIQSEINEGFLKLSENELSKKLRELGHRFPNTRAKYIYESRVKKEELFIALKKIKEDLVLREWIVKNIKGLGMKESSHFLRNIGFGEKIAILDRHILKNLNRLGVIEVIPEFLSRAKYIQIEKNMAEFAKKSNIPLSHLDLLLWYKETGEIFK